MIVISAPIVVAQVQTVSAIRTFIFFSTAIIRALISLSNESMREIRLFSSVSIREIRLISNVSIRVSIESIAHTDVQVVSSDRIRLTIRIADTPAL